MKKNSNDLSLDVHQATVLGEEPSEGVKQQLRLHADVDLHRLASGLHPDKIRKGCTIAKGIAIGCGHN